MGFNDIDRCCATMLFHCLLRQRDLIRSGLQLRNRPCFEPYDQRLLVSEVTGAFRATFMIVDAV